MEQFQSLISADDAASSVLNFCRESNLFRSIPICDLPFEETDTLIKTKSVLGTVVYGNLCGAELGCHPHKSLSYIIPSRTIDVAGNVFFCGEESIAQGSSSSFMQILLLRNGSADTRMLLAKRSLSSALPGYMARSRSTETSVKIHKELITAGLSLRHCAAAIIQHYMLEGYPSDDMVLLLGTACDDAIESLRSVIESYQATVEDTEKRSAKKIMEECTKQTDCIVCDDKPVCDGIRKFL